MGWGRMLLLGDIGQQLDIEEQKEEIKALRARLTSVSPGATASTRQKLARLEEENDRLRLYLATLIRYLIGKQVVDREEFGKLVDAVDIEDGSPNGGYKGKLVK